MKTNIDEFVNKYDLLAKTHGDPVEILFEMMADSNIDYTTRKSCASDLLSYRYPKQKAIDITAQIDQNTTGLTFIISHAVRNANAVIPAAEEFARFPLTDNRLIEYLANV